MHRVALLLALQVGHHQVVAAQAVPPPPAQLPLGTVEAGVHPSFDQAQVFGNPLSSSGMP